jgi:hypothetical protein
MGWMTGFDSVNDRRLFSTQHRPDWLWCPLSVIFNESKTKLNWPPWPESTSEPSEHLLSVELVPTFANRGCHVVSVTDPYGRILGFLDRNPYFSFHVAAQLYLQGWVGPVPDPLLLRKSSSAGNRTQDLCIWSQELWALYHRDGPSPMDAGIKAVGS